MKICTIRPWKVSSTETIPAGAILDLPDDDAQAAIREGVAEAWPRPIPNAERLALCRTIRPIFSRL